jgi:hypothetical protein
VASGEERAPRRNFACSDSSPNPHSHNPCLQENNIENIACVFFSKADRPLLSPLRLKEQAPARKQKYVLYGDVIDVWGLRRRFPSQRGQGGSTAGKEVTAPLPLKSLGS